MELFSAINIIGHGIQQYELLRRATRSNIAERVKHYSNEIEVLFTSLKLCLKRVSGGSKFLLEM